MSIDRVVLRLVTAALRRPFENRWQRYHTWTKLVVQVDGGGQVGLAECSAMETPFYSYETIETAWYVIERYLAPMLLAAGTADPAAAQAAWSDVYGHEEAKGGLECALWDLAARRSGRPLCAELGGSVRPVPVGATAGIEPTIDELLANIATIRDAGFRRARMKIRPGWDVDPVREVTAAFPDLPVIADANAAYPADAVEHLTRLDEFGLLALEQPFDRHLLATTATLQAALSTPICLDEQIHSLHEAQQAVRLKAGRIVNVKIGRVGGYLEAIRIHDLCREEGLDLFVGAKWDQGLGRYGAVAMATLPGMSLPSDTGPSDHYYADDGVDRPLAFDEPGWVSPPPGPGLGVVLTDGVTVDRTTEITTRTA